MRLVNVKTGGLEEFSAPPKYAILSHTWSGDDEVTFQDLNGYQNAALLSFSASPEARPSYNKIRHARKQAEKDGLDYLWADTCCIDKSSSAELSEAINSMFLYYSKAAICYAYLQDAPDGFPHKQVEDVVEDLTDLTGRRFISCRWFSRGWALQELLAPRRVTFYGGSNWRYLGTKETLADWIVLATGIDRETLLDPTQLRKISVARRMSWAANRNTTRIEDIAYCLLGLFGVNMPLLYGEGENAFIRLQEEIMKYSDDQTLFAWRAKPQGVKSAAYGIFARSPKQFEDSGTIVPLISGRETLPFLMTNRGLQIELAMIPFESEYLDEAGDKEYLGILDCQYEDDFSTCLAITLKQTQTPRVFVRMEGEETSLVKVTPEMAAKAVSQTLYIPRNYELMTRAYMNCQVQCETLKEHGYSLVKVLRPWSRSRSRWNPETQVMRVEAADDYGTQQFLPHATFVFRNRATGIGFAVRLDLDNIEESVCTRISRLRQHSYDYTFFNQEVLSSFLNASKGFAGSVSLLSGNIPRAPSKSARDRSGLTDVLAPPSRAQKLQSRGTGDSLTSNISMSSSMLSVDEARPGLSRTGSSISDASTTSSRLTRPGAQEDAVGSTVSSMYDLRDLAAVREQLDYEQGEADRIRIDQLLSTKKEILQSYCTVFEPSYTPTTTGRKVVLRLPKETVWKTWTIEEAQFKKMLAAFTDDWYRILERDAEKSAPKAYLQHHESMDDGSQQIMDISAMVAQQDVFGQKLHVLTIDMNLIRVFEMS